MEILIIFILLVYGTLFLYGAFNTYRNNKEEKKNHISTTIYTRAMIREMHCPKVLECGANTKKFDFSITTSKSDYQAPLTEA